jgi:acyl-CoA thioester hydrolase
MRNPPAAVSAGGVAINPVRTRIELRYRDLDLVGHVNFATYHDLLGEARAEIFFAAFDGVLPGFVIRRVELEYEAEIGGQHRYADVLTFVVSVGARSVTFSHEIVRPDGVTAAVGMATMVAFDSVRRTSRTLTDDERALFERLRNRAS